MNYPESPVKSSETGSPSNSIQSEPNQDQSIRHFYFPSGLISSNQGSVFDTDDDESAKATPKSRRLSPTGPLPLLPERDNIITYEALSPTNDSRTYGRFLTHKPSGFEGTSSDSDQDPSIIQGASVSTPELIKAFYPDNTRLSQTLTLTRTIALEQELENLKHKLEANTSELSRVTDAMHLHLENKETNMCEEVNKLRGECFRYERQNEELRAELQDSAHDVAENERTIRHLSRELDELRLKTDAYEEEMKCCIRLMTEMLDTGSSYGFDESDDLHHLTNFFSSKVEIAKSRLSRLKTKSEHAVADAKRLQAENDKYRRLIKSQTAEHNETIATLKHQLKASELKATKLEMQLTYNSKPPSYAAKPTFQKTASTRLAPRSVLESSVEKTRVSPDLYKSSQSVASSSPESIHSSQQDKLVPKSSLNESTRISSIGSKHTKVISFTDDLEGDKEQPRPDTQLFSASPERKKPVTKYLLNGRPAAPRVSSLNTSARRL